MPSSGLFGLAALFRRFQAMRDRVAQHVLQRRGHALEHVAIEFALRAVELELDLLAGIGGSLAQHPAQTRHQRIERHHARAHEAFLQLGTHARLLQQQRLVLAREVVHRLVQAGQVGGGLGQAARQLLQGREAVELQRIEGLVGGFVLALVARDDLRFGFAVQAPQLVAQTHVRLLHLAHRATERTQLLLQAGAVDRDFAGVVDETVEQVGADADLFLRCAHRRVVFVAERRVADRRRQRLEVELRRAAPASAGPAT